MLKLFISYSREDELLVNRICHDLALRDIKHWRDIKEIKVGDSISKNIEQALCDADYFCLCISKSSITKPWVMREYRTALNLQLSNTKNNLRILPLLIEKCDIPPLLLDIRYADFTTTYATGLQQLLEVLGISGLLARVRVFDIPYKEFIEHIESIKPLANFLATSKKKERSDLKHSWVSQMFSLLEQGILSTKEQVEYLMKLSFDKLIAMHPGPTITTPSKTAVLFCPRICIYSGYDFISDDLVVPNIHAMEGFNDFLDNLITHRVLIEKRQVFLLPEMYVVEGESYPDGMWTNQIDNRVLKKKLGIPHSDD